MWKLSFVLGFCLIDSIHSHSYLTAPITRSNQAQTQTGCRGPACLGPCEVPLSKAKSAPIATQRGNQILLKWPRNNHAGGFTRVAWSLTSQSDDRNSFNANVQSFACFEVGCKSSTSDPLGGDSNGQGPGKCTNTINVPSHLSDGNWTMQWAWFGGAYQLGDYYSCVDYAVSGGGAVAGQRAPATFTPGDASFDASQNKCLYFNTNKLGVCVNEPCTTGATPGKQSGPPDNFSAGPAAAKSPPLPPSATTLVPSSSSSVSSLVLPTAPASSPVPVSSPIPVKNTVKSSVPNDSSDSNDSVPPSSSLDSATTTAQSTSQQINVTYTQTFSDPQSGSFGAVLVVTNTAATSLPAWKLLLAFPDGSTTLDKAYGASLLLDFTSKSYLVRSNGPLVGNGSVRVGLIGTLNNASLPSTVLLRKREIFRRRHNSI